MYPLNTAELYANLEAKAAGNALFADFDTYQLSYTDLHKSIGAITSIFRQHHLARQSPVVVLSSSTIQTTLLFFATLFDDLVPVILSADTRAPRVQSIIDRVAPAMIFADQSFRETWPWLNDYNSIFLPPPQTDAPQSPISRFLKQFRKNDLSGLIPEPDSTQRATPRCTSGPSDTANIIFSSGTTAQPKGILTTHGSLFSHLKTICNVFEYSDKSRLMNNLDLAHADGLLQGPMLALFSGATLYRPEQFCIQNLERLLNQVYSRRITHLVTVPTILALMERLLPANDYFEDASFQTVISVAGKLETELWEKIQKRFKVRVSNIYGLTETVAGGLFCGPNDDTFKLGTVGKPIDMEAKVVDDKGTSCPAGTEGELLVRGENVFGGYLDSPEANAEAFYGDWLRTGDIAVQDPDGFYSIIGRKKAVIVSGGFNIHPDEVTEALSRYPGVDEAATVGLADKEWGEIVVSGYCSQEDLTEEELLGHCRQNLEQHKVPKRIVRLKAIPRTISGKVRLQDFRNQLDQLTQQPETSTTGQLEKKVLKIAAEVFKIPMETVSLSASPEETPGWDSLNHLNLITAAEKHFHVQFGIHEMMEVRSLATLVQILSQKATDDD